MPTYSTRLSQTDLVRLIAATAGVREADVRLTITKATDDGPCRTTPASVSASVTSEQPIKINEELFLARPGPRPPSGFGGRD